MANVPINFGGGSGSGSDDCTAVASNVLTGKTAIVNGSDDEPVNGSLPLAAVLSANGGSIPTKSDSGNVTINTSTTSKNYAAGYYPNAHGAQVVTQTKTTAAGTGNVSVSPDQGKVLSGVTVTPTPVQTKSATPTASAAQTIYPDAGYHLSAVTVAKIPNQTAGGDVKLTASSSSSTKAANVWLTSRHYVYVDVYTWS